MYSRRGSVFSSRRRRGIGRWVALGLVGLLVVCGVYTFFDNNRIVVKTQRVLSSSLDPKLEGFTVLHISDLNGKRFGEGQRRLVSAMRGRKYDAVCITGDMVGPKGDPYPFYELLAALNPGKPVFFIDGNADPATDPASQGTHSSILADWILGAQTRGAVYLGAPASMTVGEATVWFTEASQLALDLDTAESAYAAAGTSLGAYNLDIITKTKLARAQMKPEDLHITLAHKPLSGTYVQSAARTSGENFARTVDIILSGNMVGGQWRLPLIGPVWADGWFPSDETVQGYRYTGGLLQYISTGLSTSADNPLPGFRLFNPPSVTLITFTSQMSEDVLPESAF